MYILYFFRISTANLDAVGGVDFVAIVNRQITFSPGDPTIKAIPVTILQDNITENNEKFTVILTAENGINVRPGFNTTTVTIEDNDGKDISGYDAYTVALPASRFDLFMLIFSPAIFRQPIR